MSTVRTLDDVMKRLEESKRFYEARIAAWEGVKYPTKKDGTQFKVLSKNFDGAYIGVYSYVESWERPYLTVSGYEGRGRYDGYFQDHLPIYFDSFYKDLLPSHNDAREVRQGAYTTNEVLTIDEIKKAVEYRIENYKKYLADVEHSITIAEERFNAVKEHIDQIKAIIGENKPGVRNSLYYPLCDYVQQYPYCR